MIDVKKNRINYGKSLVPPTGYKFSKAITTTYSLDFQALCSACVSLGLEEAYDPDLFLANKVTAYNAIENVAKNLAIFCEAGQMKFKSKMSPLIILLERTLVQVTLKGKERMGYPSFHPKMWMIEYVNKTNAKAPKKYKLLVLSRNLTLDRSWDMAVVMEGEESSSSTDKNNSLISFFQFLKKQIHQSDGYSIEKRALVSYFSNALKKITFSTFWDDVDDMDYSFIPLGIGPSYNWSQEELFQLGKYDRLMVVSPFLSRPIIEKLNGKVNDSILVTRKLELPKIKSLEPTFRTYVLSGDIVNGEESIIDSELPIHPQSEDIHAKMYILRKGQRTYVYIGSMNATSRGTGMYESSPGPSHNSNVELVVKLSTKEANRQFSRFEKSLLGDDNNSFFEQVNWNEVPEIQENEIDWENKLLNEIKVFCRIPQKGMVVGNNRNYDLEIEFELGNNLFDHLTIAPLFAPEKAVSLQNKLTFTDLSLNQISELFVVKAIVKNEIMEEVTVQKVIKINLQDIPDDRDKEIVKYAISSQKDFAEYMEYLLSFNPIQTYLGLQENKKRYHALEIRNQVFYHSLYENLLRIVTTDPSRLVSLNKIIDAISDNEIIPQKFHEFYQTFQTLVK